MLNPDRRKQLEDLINQAESNGENPDFIQNELIPSFKSKYDVQTEIKEAVPVTPQPPAATVEPPEQLGQPLPPQPISQEALTQPEPAPASSTLVAQPTIPTKFETTPEQQARGKVISELGIPIVGVGPAEPPLEEVKAEYSSPSKAFISGAKSLAASGVEYLANIVKPGKEQKLGGRLGTEYYEPTPEMAEVKKQQEEAISNSLMKLSEKIRDSVTPEEQANEQKSQDVLMDVWKNPAKYLNPANIPDFISAFTTNVTVNAPQTILSLIPYAGQATMIATEGGRWGEQAKELGIQDENIIRTYQSLYGIPSGLIETYMNRLITLPLGGKTNPIAKKLTSVADKIAPTIFGKIALPLINMLGGSIGEASEEVTQGTLSDALMGLALRDQAQLYLEAGNKEKANELFGTAQDFINNAKDLSTKSKEAILAGFAGLGLGAGGAVISKVYEKATEKHGEISKPTEQVPVSPEQVPVSPGQVPVSPGQVPGAVGEMEQQIGIAGGKLTLENLRMTPESFNGIMDQGLKDNLWEQLTDEAKSQVLGAKPSEVVKKAEPIVEKSAVIKLLEEKKALKGDISFVKKDLTEQQQQDVYNEIKDVAPEKIDDKMAEINARITMEGANPEIIMAAYNAGVLKRENVRLRSAVKTGQPFIEAKEEQSITIDKVTGLPDSNTIRRQLETPISKTEPAPLEDKNKLILMIDVDDFKSINETHGHAEGDNVLSGLGNLIKESFGDVLHGRYGGEEFIGAVLPNNNDSVKKSADFIKTVSKELKVKGEPVTISAGLGSGTVKTEKGATRIYADKLLNEAKESGKNQLVVDISGKKSYIKGIGGERKYVEIFRLRNLERGARELLNRPEISESERNAINGTLQAVQRAISGYAAREAGGTEKVAKPEEPKIPAKPPIVEESKRLTKPAKPAEVKPEKFTAVSKFDDIIRNHGSMQNAIEDLRQSGATDIAKALEDYARKSANYDLLGKLKTTKKSMAKHISPKKMLKNYPSMKKHLDEKYGKPIDILLKEYINAGGRNDMTEDELAAMFSSGDIPTKHELKFKEHEAVARYNEFIKSGELFKETERRKEPRRAEGERRAINEEGRETGKPPEGIEERRSAEERRTKERRQGGVSDFEVMTIEEEAAKAAEEKKGVIPPDEIKPSDVEQNPSDAQKEAENYKVAHTSYDGLQLSVENPMGSVRSGTDEDGKAWETTMKQHYGRILKTTGFDKDHIDFFLNPDAKGGEIVHVINQVNPENGEFDEHKVVFGYDNLKQAMDAYLSNYPEGWKGLASITPMTQRDFKEWAFSNKPQQGALLTGGTQSARIVKPKQRKAEAPKTTAGIYKASLLKTPKGTYMIVGSIPEELSDKRWQTQQEAEKAYTDLTGEKLSIPWERPKEPVEKKAPEEEIKKEIKDIGEGIQAEIYQNKKGNWTTRTYDTEAKEVVELIIHPSEESARKKYSSYKAIVEEKPPEIEKKEIAKAPVEVVIDDETVTEEDKKLTGVKPEVKSETVEKITGKVSVPVNVKIENQQILVLFKSIPKFEIRKELKKNNFRWSPYIKAWVAIYNPNRMEFVKNYFGVNINDAEAKTDEENIKKTAEELAADKVKDEAEQVKKILDKVKATPKPTPNIYQKMWRKLIKIVPTISDMNIGEAKDLKSSGFMDLHIERLSAEEFSLSHTYEQNGDLMRDPEVVIRLDPVNGLIEALSFRQDNMGIDQVVYPEPGMVNMDVKNGTNRFLNFWLNNLIAQGHKIMTDAEIAEIENKRNANIKTNRENTNADANIVSSNIDDLGGEQAEDVSGIEGEGDIGTGGVEAGEVGERNILESEETGDTTPRSYGSGDGVDISSEHGTGTRADGELRAGRTDDRSNYHIKSEDNLGQGGPVQKFEDNINAIKTLKLLEQHGRLATPEEQRILVKYTGWGWAGSTIFDTTNKKYDEQRKELKNIITDEEYQSAKGSIINAHYTSPEVIQAIWTAIEKMGFSGGKALEPGVGIGHFLGLSPANLNIAFTGIDMDTLTGNIAKHLYQGHDINVMPYQEYNIAKDSFSLGIGNVPFGQIRIFDKNAKEYWGSKDSYYLHDFYFLKTLYGIKPGGVIAFITSKGTMDKSDQVVRSLISNKADFLGAIRLPKETFKANAGTQVVTDIIFLQKRKEGDPVSQLTKTFMRTGTVNLTNPRTKNKFDVSVNRYFLENPHMVIGEMQAGGQYAESDFDLTFKGEYNELIAELNKKIENLPTNIMSNIVKDREKIMVEKDVLIPKNLDEYRDDSYFLDDKGELYKKVNGKAIPVKYYKEVDKAMLKAHPKWVEAGIREGDLSAEGKKGIEERGSDIKREKIRAFIKIRDAALKLEKAEKQPDAVDSELNKLRFDLNKHYDNFVKKYGYVNLSRNAEPFWSDPDAGLVLALEHYDHLRKTATKADMLLKRLYKPHERAIKAGSTEDALMINIVEDGVINWDRISELSGMSKHDVQNDLIFKGFIFKNPSAAIDGNEFVLKDEYLSGNVRYKLREAEIAYKKDNSLQRNIDALKAVVPKDIEPTDITVKVNSPWLPHETVKSFISDIFEEDEDMINLYHDPLLGIWKIETRGWIGGNTKISETYGVPKKNGLKILEMILNNKSIRVEESHSDPITGKTTITVDEEQTAMAKQKAKSIKEEFAKWIWSDSGRSIKLARKYNDEMNAIVNTLWEAPAQMKFPGLSSSIKLRENQKNAVWRIVRSILKSNTLLAHEVGAGKTLEMIVSAMECRRLGIKNKPMIVVPNHMIEQFRGDFMRAYPGAKVLVSSTNAVKPINRKTFMNKIRTGDWDCIIVKQSHFGMLDVSPQLRAKHLSILVDKYENALMSIKAAKLHDKRTQKNIETSLKKLRERIAKLMSMPKDYGVAWDDLGIDMLMMDEADMFKNLQYVTKMTKVAGMGTPSGSERAFDLSMKIWDLQKKNNGGGVVFATGTPISNSMVEIYTMMQYLQPDVLKAHKINILDYWVNNFAETTTAMELSSSAGRFVERTRLTEYQNIPELMNILRESWDIMTAEMLSERGILVPGKNLPVLKGGKPDITITPSYELLNDYKDWLARREEIVRKHKGSPQKGRDNHLVIVGDGRRAAVDMRLINPNFVEVTGSKIDVLSQGVYKKYKETMKEKGTQLIFYNLTKAESKYPFSIQKDIKKKLVAMGIPADEIAFMEDANTDLRKQVLFDDMNTGKKRVLLGSVANMGAGTNVQVKLKTVWWMDPPWRPRDIAQGNGRIIRQGNGWLDLGKEVEINILVQQGSFETYMWNILENKARTINKIMSGKDKTTRKIEDDPGGFQNMRIASIDNPYLMEAAILEQQVREMEMLRKGSLDLFTSAQYGVVSRTQRIEEFKKDIETFKSLKSKTGPLPEKFEMEIGDKSFDNVKDAAEALWHVMDTHVKKKDGVPNYNIGKIKGVPFGFDGVKTKTSTKVDDNYVAFDSYLLALIYELNGKKISITFQTGAIPGNSLKAFFNRVFNTEHIIKKYADALRANEDQLKIDQAIVTRGTAFEKEEEYQKKLVQFDEIKKKVEAEQDRIQAEKASRPVKYDWKALEAEGRELRGLDSADPTDRPDETDEDQAPEEGEAPRLMRKSLEGAYYDMMKAQQDMFAGTTDEDKRSAGQRAADAVQRAREIEQQAKDMGTEGLPLFEGPPESEQLGLFSPRLMRTEEAGGLPSLRISGIELSTRDFKSAINKYAQQHGVFNGKTYGFDKAHRTLIGQKLWENMSESERLNEFADYAVKDFQQASKEMGDNPADYIENRALDYLDPMSDLYKIILQKLGYEVSEKGIRPPKKTVKNILFKKSSDLIEVQQAMSHIYGGEAKFDNRTPAQQMADTESMLRGANAYFAGKPKIERQTFLKTSEEIKLFKKGEVVEDKSGQGSDQISMLKQSVLSAIKHINKSAVSELDISVSDELNGVKFAPFDIAGVQQKGKETIVVFNSTAPANSNMAEAAVHELIGHFGTWKVLSKNPHIKNALNYLYNLDKKSIFTKELKDKYRSYWGYIAAIYGEKEADAVLFDEWIAARMEQVITPETMDTLSVNEKNLVSRIYDFMKQAVEWLLNKLKLSYSIPKNISREDFIKSQVDDILKKVFRAMGTETMAVENRGNAILNKIKMENAQVNLTEPFNDSDVTGPAVQQMGIAAFKKARLSGADMPSTFDEEVTKLVNKADIENVTKPQELVLPENTELKSENELVEERWKGAKGITRNQGSIVERIVEGVKQSTRHFPLLEGTRYAGVQDVLRQYEAVPGYSKAAAVNVLKGVTAGMTPAHYDVFTRLLILPDMLKDVDRGLYDIKNEETGETELRPLPFGYTSREQIDNDIAKFNKIANANPIIIEAVNARNRFMDKLKKELVYHGLLHEKTLEYEAYFHHQVLEQIALQDQLGLGVSPEEVRLRKKGWQKQRKGSSKDFNTEYVEAEYEVIAQAISQLETIRTLKKVKMLEDVSDQLKKEANGANREALAQKYAGMFDNNGKPVDPLFPFRQKIAIASGKLESMAANGRFDLPIFSTFEPTIQRLISDYRMKEITKNEEFPVGQYDSEPDPQYFKFLSFIMGLGEEAPGGVQSATIFKAIRDRNNTIKSELGANFKTWEDFIPEGYTTWQPEKGRHFYQVLTVSDKVIDEALKQTDATMMEIPEVKKAMAIGQKYKEWVIPVELARTLDTFREYRTKSWPENLAIQLSTTWKQWTLINPLKAPKYNINNMSGDLDIALAYDPAILKYMKQAGKDLWAYNMKGGLASPEIMNLIKKGVIGSGMSIAEIPDISDEGFFKILTTGDENNIIKKAWSKTGGMVWEKSRDFTNWRENILRLAAYRYFKDKIKANPKTKIYAASKAGEIDGISNPDDKAAKLARELIGDYGNISSAGQYIRRTLIPFFSWVEINAPRYWRLIKNLPEEGQGTGKVVKVLVGKTAKGMVKLALKAQIMAILIQLYNRIFWPDEEDELGEQRKQLHLILGKNADGSIRSIRMQGALSDALNWFAAADYPWDIKELVEEKKTFVEKLQETGKAPINKIWSGFNPFLKALYELPTGKTTYPDIWKPRPIRDKAEYLARMWSMDMPYKIAKGRPMTGAGQQFANIMTYETEPGEQAYYDIQRMAYDFLDRNGLERPAGTPTDKGNAIYYYKQALKMEDKAAAQKYLKEYAELGGTVQGFIQSVKMANPLAPLGPDARKAAFIKTLSETDKKTLKRAYEYYKETYQKVREYAPD